MKKWKCTVCGYIHNGDEPPEKCPVCGADRSKFVLLEDAPAAAENKSAAQAPPASHPSPSATQTQATQPKAAAQKSSSARYQALSEWSTRIHGHPIAVHIPNGVLPVAVIFTFLGLVFGSEAFAAAGKYNLIFVALSMPVVITTGVVDWTNRFKARMTKVFSTKMICGGIVTLLSLVLSIWWLVNPNILMEPIAQSGTFFLLHLVNLAAAVVAGWYGGKLVFRK